MLSSDIVLDSLNRVHELIPVVLDGLDRDDVLWRPDAGSNSIGWLIWHLCRVDDDHLGDLGGQPQVWLSGWSERFGLPYPPNAHGYGMTAADIAAFDLPSVSLLADYASAVAEQSRRIVTALTASDYEKVIDTRWDPPVTISARLVSVMVETAQHIGQAGYVRGLRERQIGRESGWAGHP